MLHAVVGADGPVGCTQLAREYGLDVTRVNRILGTLAYLGVLQRTRSRKYMPGAGIHVLAAMSLRGSQLVTCAFPHCQALAKQLKMEPSLGVLWRTRVSFVHVRTSGKDAGTAFASALMPAHQSAIGRVLLAQYPDEEIHRQYADTGGEDADVAKVIDRLAKVRRDGYAMGARRNSLAVGIGDPAVAGLAVEHHNRERIPAAEVSGLLDTLQAAADAIAEEMAAKRVR